MSGSPEEINEVLDVVNRTEYMRGYDARNEELKKDPARLNIELNHSYYKTGYLQGQYDMRKRMYKAIDRIKESAEPWYMGRVDGKPSNAVLLETAVKIIRDYMEGERCR